jgi:hypothetical protein
LERRITLGKKEKKHLFLKIEKKEREAAGFNEKQIRVC